MEDTLRSIARDTYNHHETPLTLPGGSDAPTLTYEDVVVPFDPNEQGFRKIVRNFPPSWFVVNMGTGIVSTLLIQIPFPSRWLEILATLFLGLNVILFVVFSTMTCLRYAMYPELWGALLRHPTQRLFLGTIPTGFATILNVSVFICGPAWGQRIVIAAWAFWWLNCVLSIVICFHLTYMVVTFPKTDLSAMTPIWLIPTLPVVICSTSGGIIASALTNPQHQLWTLLLSYILWGVSIPLALAIILLYFHRLTVHKMLDKDVIVSACLPVGPFGLGGYSIFLFGKLATSIFPKNGTLGLVPNAGESLYVFGFLIALLMWGFGLVWFFFAINAIIQTKRFPFNMGWWSFTFPIGVFALSTIQLGKEMDSLFFKVLGTVISVMVFLLYTIVVIGTCHGAVTQEIFYAPCLGTDMKLQQLKMRRIAALETGDKTS